MMRTSILAALLVPALGLMACTTPEKEVAPVQNASLKLLGGGEWKVFEINGQPIAANTYPTIQFENGRVSGAGSCNRFMGDYTVASDAITLAFSKMASTMMACQEPAMQQEALYLKALGDSTSFRIEDGVLVLRAPDGQVIKARR